jgi:hypothetical protein
VLGEVSDEIIRACFVHDDLSGCVYHALQAHAQGKVYEPPSKLVEEEALQVAVILSEMEERRRYPGIEDALASSMEQLRRPPLLPHMTPPPLTPLRPHCTSRSSGEV